MKRFAVGLVLAATTGVAGAQGFPSRAITLISPFPPGGSTDTTARIIAERMRAPLGQSVVVENVGGAGGTIGVARLARATPDGYTIDIGQWDTHVGQRIGNSFASVPRNARGCGVFRVGERCFSL